MRYTEHTRREAAEAGRLNPHSGWGPVEPDLEAGNDWEEDDLETVVKLEGTISPISPRRVEPRQKLAQPRIVNRTPGRADRQDPTTMTPRAPMDVPNAPSLAPPVPQEEQIPPTEQSVAGTVARVALVVAGVGAMAIAALFVGVSSMVFATTDVGQQAAASISTAVAQGTASMIASAAQLDAPDAPENAPVANDEPEEAAPLTKRTRSVPSNPVPALNNQSGAEYKVVYKDGFKPTNPARVSVTADAEFVVVYVDGNNVGTTPVNLELERGEHHVRLAKGIAWGIHKLETPEEGQGWCFEVKGEKIMPRGCE